MAAQSLNVRVGLIFDEKSLAGIERSMRNSGKRLSSIGTELSMSLSLPLAAFGVTAIKAAGDIESLTLALKSQLGTAEAAAKELDLLTEAARNPGLGVEQAVRGSVRLQGVGFAAEEARETLIQMGNAIASTGGGAEQLDRVTMQFAQMTSKGRVLQEEISVISESMPGLAQLMQKAFGTSSAEAIQKMGISGKEFVNQITKAAAELPRVEGGIKNGIGNAIDDLKQSAAKVGFAINEAFDITGLIENVSAAVLGLAMAFSSLDPTMKSVILSAAGMLIAIGPLTKGYGALKLAVAQLTPLWGPFAGALSTITKGFLALNTAAKSFILIGIAAAVLAIADSWGWFNQEATVAQKAQSSINKVMDEAEASISGEKAAIGKLIAVLNDETSSREAKKKALNDLKAISPEYFGQLRIENGLVVGLASAYEGYIQNILLAAKAKKAEARLIEIDQQKTEQLKLQAQEQERLNKLQADAPVRREGFGARDSFDAGGGTSAAGAAAAKITESKKITEQLALEEAELLKVSKQYFETSAQAAAGGKMRTGAATQATAATKEESKALKILKEVLSDIENAEQVASLIGDDADIAKADALRKGIEKLVDAGFKPASAEVQNLKAQLDALTAKPQEIVIDIIQNGQPPTVPTSNRPERPNPSAPVPTSSREETQEEKTLREAFEYAKDAGISEKALEWATNIGLGATAIRSFTDGLVTMADQAGPAFEGLAGSLLGLQGAYKSVGVAALAAASQMVKAALASTLATAIQDSFEKSGNPLIGIALAGIAVAGVNALFGKIQQSLSKTPKFARGTNFAPGGMALVGEQGPELVNLPRGSKVFTAPQTNQMLNTSISDGGNVNVSGEFLVRGTDLVLVLDRVNTKNQRFR